MEWPPLGLGLWPLVVVRPARVFFCILAVEYPRSLELGRHPEMGCGE
jgi:hypothetical protein